MQSNNADVTNNRLPLYLSNRDIDRCYLLCRFFDLVFYRVNHVHSLERGTDLVDW